ncbi:T9SS type A sorting domain-containing protein [Rosettibacter firmus]|uniref:pectate lyase family protein n=1 Tax=Rosettibacter firmus TaxID=3111522 RepID=UPI00336BB501
MTKFKSLILISIFISYNLLAQNEVIIQENELGFCSVDGTIATSVTGYTGKGYADTDLGIGKSISWQINVLKEGTFSFIWRYAVSGNTQERNAKLLINGNVVVDTVYFPRTGDQWNSWKESNPVQVNLKTGYHKIRLESYSPNGLGNYDYFKIIGDGIEPAQCTPSYILTVKSNNDDWGTVEYSPVQNYYDEGTIVTLKAHPKPGYFFESWLGEETSADSIFTFVIKSNVNAVARFLPLGIKADTNLIGYATIQDDKGTPFMVIGGALGDTVIANNLEDLKNYLSSEKPYVVKFSGKIEGSDVIQINSDKTLLGYGNQAYLKGIELSINNARNVIIKNITVSHVTPQDAVEINGKSKNIWIDHCEFFSDREHGVDYYDGLLDIKNASSFITVSWCNFHDHYKTILISSGDEQYADTVIRVTFHHNYFYNCESRLPSIRFGKAHIFNNYYKNCNTAINTRMGACVRVENNYFENVGKAVFSDYSSIPGAGFLLNNYLGSSSIYPVAGCNLDVPYDYQKFLDEPEILPELIPANVKTKVENNVLPQEFFIGNYPNPFNSETKIILKLPVTSDVKLIVYNLLGQKLITLIDQKLNEGNYDFKWNAVNMTSGIYFYQLITNNTIKTGKMILMK